MTGHKNKLFKKFTYFVFVSCLLIGLTYLYYELVGDFRKGNITYELPEHLIWTTPEATSEQTAWLDDLLNQKFRWLGEGRQIYAFASQDGKYVLKVFKFNRLKPSVLLNYFSYIPIFKEYCMRQERKRLHRLDKLFLGYRTAYHCDPQYSSIRFIHLNKSTDLKRQVIITDRLGIEHRLNADEIIFAIQDYARNTKEVLTSFLEKGDLANVKQHIRQLFDMYLAEYSMGIMDQDRNILSNTGFAKSHPMRLDVGQLKQDDTLNPSVYKADLIKIATTRLNRWLHKHYPEVHAELSRDMEEKLSEIFGEPFTF